MKYPLKILNKIFKKSGYRIGYKLWDHNYYGPKNPEFTLCFYSKRGFKSLIFNNSIMNFCEKYINKEFDIEGDIFKAISLKKYLQNNKPTLKNKINIMFKLRQI